MASSLTLYGQGNTFNVSEGVNAPQGRSVDVQENVTPGDIVPDTITFAMDASQAPALSAQEQLEGINFRFPELSNFSYSDFPNEVIISLYHTPW